jgi:hypothetical protein
MKVIDYSLIESDSHAELVEAVAEACRTDGWFPSGGVCIWVVPPRLTSTDAGPGYSPTYSELTTHYAQALVKYGP